MIYLIVHIRKDSAKHIITKNIKEVFCKKSPLKREIKSLKKYGRKNSFFIKFAGFRKESVFPKRYIFPENFVEITYVVMKIWRFSPSILTIFIKCLDFLTFPCFATKKPMALEYQRWSQHFFIFQITLNRFFNNFMELYWY